MRRRVVLPGAAELFRTTGTTHATGVVEDEQHEQAGEPQRSAAPARSPSRSGSGRRKHDAKITVYVSDEELVALEQARLVLRAEHGLAVDRGRVVREAVAVLLTDLDARGAESVLVQRLLQERGE